MPTCELKFVDELHTDGPNTNTNEVFVDYRGWFKQIKLPKAEMDKHVNHMFQHQMRARLANQVVLMANMDRDILQVTTERYALCISFGIEEYEYDTYVKEYRGCCEIRTFISSGKTYLFIIKKNILEQIVNNIRGVYEMRMSRPLEKLHLRVSATIGCKLTNTPPTQFRERYLEIDMTPFTKTPVNLTSILKTRPISLSTEQKKQLVEEVNKFNEKHAETGISACVATSVDNSNIVNNTNMYTPTDMSTLNTHEPASKGKNEMMINEHEEHEDNQTTCDMLQPVDHSRDFAWYKNNYQMGDCVIVLNQFRLDNPMLDLDNYVFRLVATKRVGHYDGTLSVVSFKELDRKGDKINSHVIMCNQNKRIVDPLFGLNDITIDDYIKHIVRENLIVIDSEFKEILFDLQPLTEEHRKNNRSQFIPDADIMCRIYNIQTKTLFVDEMINFFFYKGILIIY